MKRMSDADILKAKEAIKKLVDEGIWYGIFSTRNTVGDTMQTVFECPDCKIDVCNDNGYLEVFCHEEDFALLKQYYSDEVENF